MRRSRKISADRSASTSADKSAGASGINTGATNVVVVDPDLEPLIPKFLAHLERELAELKDAATRGDLEPLKAKGHTLKGDCGGYGFDELGALAAKLEKSAAAGDATQARDFVARMNSYFAAIELRYAA